MRLMGGLSCMGGYSVSVLAARVTVSVSNGTKGHEGRNPVPGAMLCEHGETGVHAHSGGAHCTTVESRSRSEPSDNKVNRV